jgi:endo-1,4-beta-xylanase
MVVFDTDTLTLFIRNQSTVVARHREADRGHHAVSSSYFGFAQFEAFSSGSEFACGELVRLNCLPTYRIHSIDSPRCPFREVSIMRMKLSVLASLLFGLVASLMVHAGGDQTPKEIPLWEKGAPGFEGRKDEKENRVNQGKDIIIKNVHNPSIALYLPPKDKATGTAVIIAPGGGHNSLWIAHEGYNPAKWLSEHGIAAFVLKYRLAREKGSPYKIETHAVEDGERAIRYVRSKAKDWGIDPDRVGIMGFSAGGELAAYLTAKGEKVEKGKSDATDPVDRESAWPNYQVLIYSGPLGIKGAKITKDFPPTFIAYGETDKQSAPLTPYYESLKAAGVPAELYILPKTGHGFGLRDANKGPSAEWPQHFVDWLVAKKLLKK